MKIGPVQWGVAMVAALGLHGGLLSLHKPTVETGAKGLGSGGLEISVTMTAAALGADEDRQAQEEVVSEIEEPTDAPDPQEVAEPAPTPPEEIAEVEPTPEPIPEPMPEPIPEPLPEPVAEPEVEPVPEPLPEPLPEPEAVAMLETVPEPIPVPEPIVPEVQPEPEPVPEEVTPVVELPRPEMPKAPPRPEPVLEKPVVQEAAAPQDIAEPQETVETAEPAGAPAQAQVASVASIASAGASATAPAGQSTDAATSQGGDAVVAPSPDYLSHLRYWLERHKEYPRLARRRGMEGVVVVALRVARDGALVNRGIREGSGFDILDKETLELLSRADPMPAFPTDMKGKYLDVVVPIEYSLRGS